MNKPNPSNLGRLSNDEFDLAKRLLRDAGLPTKCLCLQHHLDYTPYFTDSTARTAAEAIPCIMDEICFNEHYLLAGLRGKDLIDRWELLPHPAHQDTIGSYGENLEELVGRGLWLDTGGHTRNRQDDCGDLPHPSGRESMGKPPRDIHKLL